MKNKKSVVEMRRAQILNTLHENPHMKVDGLAELLGVSYTKGSAAFGIPRSGQAALRQSKNR